jgi:hypothetical protein
LAFRAGKGRLDKPPKELAGRRSLEWMPGDQKNLDHGGMGALATSPVNLGHGIGEQLLNQRLSVLGRTSAD